MHDTTETPEDRAPGSLREAGHGIRSGGPDAGLPGEPPEPRGCLFALSQPPLMLFLAVIGALVFLAAVHDLLLL
ncbi:hypothetical protein IQ279_24310 [Streptomyces verrucosisporus]|uniref:hypothetical protein n=1 Tax=Streptomyces verrucosisporus TaxID=1695161 RepID=UPI0019D23766|nr:hypothetical protein [Streptomyces verrucosisporus]MBN3932697.1 hypothetical protein [Streptomyces verrucosisporus]